MKVQSKLVQCDSEIAMRKENFRRLLTRMKLLRQVDATSQVAAAILVEMWRRKKFSTTFTQVGSAHDLLSLFNF